MTGMGVHVRTHTHTHATKIHTDIGTNVRSLSYSQPLVRTLGCHKFILYSTLGHVGGSKQVWRIYPVGGCYNTCWLMGLWSTQATVERIVLKAAWHWSNNSSVRNNPLGEAGCTPMYVHRRCVYVGLCFFPFHWRAA